MLELRSFATLTLLFAVAELGLAQEKPVIRYAQPEYISAANGPEMFRAYCAVCHGADAKGDGPAAPALRKAPADLTRLSHNNGGTFPAILVKRTIRGSGEVASHGSREMPIWGAVFRAIGDDAIVQLRIANLTRYLESIQSE